MAQALQTSFAAGPALESGGSLRPYTPPSGSFYPPERFHLSGEVRGLGPRHPWRRRTAETRLPREFKGCELMIETEGFKQDLIAIRKMILEAGDSL